MRALVHPALPVASYLVIASRLTSIFHAICCSYYGINYVIYNVAFLEMNDFLCQLCVCISKTIIVQDRCMYVVSQHR